MYHSVGTLLPNGEEHPQFAQIYIYDTDNELQNRMNIMPNLDPNILMKLQQMLNDINPYVKTFCQASDMLKSNQLLDMKMVITDNRTTDPQRYNIPRAAEVAVIMVGNKKLNKQNVILYCSYVKEDYSEYQKYIVLMHYYIMFLCFPEVKMDSIPLFLYVMICLLYSKTMT